MSYNHPIWECDKEIADLKAKYDTLLAAWAICGGLNEN